MYRLDQLGGGTEKLTFVRRSGSAVQYETDWAGVQTQEVLRALIDRTKYLYKVLPCEETKRAEEYLRLALFEYEKRAYRRKKAKVNRTELAHDDSDENVVPFTEKDIEFLPVGEDGHIIVEK